MLSEKLVTKIKTEGDAVLDDVRRNWRIHIVSAYKLDGGIFAVIAQRQNARRVVLTYHPIIGGKMTRPAVWYSFTDCLRIIDKLRNGQVTYFEVYVRDYVNERYDLANKGAYPHKLVRAGDLE